MRIDWDMPPRSRTNVAGPTVIKEQRELPPPIRAAQLALLIMKAVDLSTWVEVCEADPAMLVRKVALDDEQHMLLEQHMSMLEYVQRDPLCVPYLCSGCGRIGFLARGKSPSANCKLKVNCEGNPIRTPLTMRRNPAQQASIARA